MLKEEKIHGSFTKASASNNITWSKREKSSYVHNENIPSNFFYIFFLNNAVLPCPLCVYIYVTIRIYCWQLAELILVSFLSFSVCSQYHQTSSRTRAIYITIMTTLRYVHTPHTTSSLNVYIKLCEQKQYFAWVEKKRDFLSLLGSQTHFYETLLRYLLKYFFSCCSLPNSSLLFNLTRVLCVLVRYISPDCVAIFIRTNTHPSFLKVNVLSEKSQVFQV